MKKLIILFVVFAMFSCSGNQGYTIKIQMDDLAGIEMALRQNVNGELVGIDSVMLDSSGFGEMSGNITAPEMMYLGRSDSRSTIPIFMDNNNYTVSGNFNDAKIEADGGPQVEYDTYKKAVSTFQDKQEEIVEAYNEAKSSGINEDSLKHIIDSYYLIENEKSDFDSAYLVQNPSSAVSLFILRGMFYEMDEVALESALSLFEENLQNTSYYKYLSEYLTNMKNVRIGSKYVDFELPDSLGNPMKLSDFVAKDAVLMIDFWASWCGPCRRANPGVVKIYNKYKEKGFDIVGVSLDNSREDWLKAIQADGLTWHHISDLQGWKCDGAKIYAVSSIPHTVLIDSEGTIIAKNLSEEDLDAKLSELLSK